MAASFLTPPDRPAPSPDPVIDHTTALLVIDAQRAIDDPRWGQRNNPDAESVIARLLAHWRSKNAPVIHVHHQPTDPASTFQGSGQDIKPEAQPRSDELRIHKTTPCAFTQTELDSFCRSEGFHRLVICGFITENSVESTVRTAGNRGYETWVVANACATFARTDLNGTDWTAENIHQLSLSNMAQDYARIIQSDDLIR
ncbi:cysteine hydrolase family protein [Rhodovibrionaceae bacterium A322]